MTQYEYDYFAAPLQPSDSISASFFLLIVANWPHLLIAYLYLIDKRLSLF